MKYSLRHLFFWLASLFSFATSFGQTKADVMTCFNQVLALPEVSAIIEQKQLKSPELIILKMENRPFYPTKEEKVFLALEELDFRNVPAPAIVRLLSKREIKNEEITASTPLNLRFRFSEGRLILFISTFVEESRRFFKGYFSFEEEAGNWELVTKQLVFR